LEFLLKSAISLNDYFIFMPRCWWEKGLGLCEEAELEVEMVNLAQIPNVQFNIEPAFLQNPCCLLLSSLL
jgi:hypothetical protein